MKMMAVYLILIGFWTTSCLAESIFIHPNSQPEDQFQNQVSDFKGITLTDFLTTRFQFNKEKELISFNTTDQIQQAIQSFESQPLLRGDSEILIGLYRKLYLQNPRSVPISRVIGIFLSHPKMQDYYFDFWEQIKPQAKVSKISDDQRQLIQNILKNRKLMIDGQFVNIENLNELSGLPHQWLLFSNTTIPILYQGTVEGFLIKSQEQKEPTDLCLNEIQPFPSISQFQITVLNGDPICKGKQQNMVSTKSNEEGFYQQNKNWIIPTGIGLGAMLILGLKDKKIALKFPSFHF